MKAEQFYAAFESSFASSAVAAGLKKMSGRTSKWKVHVPAGRLVFAFATNFKTAGLLPHMPGEFRLQIAWSRSASKSGVPQQVSLFQYTTEEENEQYAALQRIPLEKFLKQDGKEQLRQIFNYAQDSSWRPRANIEEFCSYFDAEDAAAWGAWFGASAAPWLERFIRSPESHEDWCWRVLWPHLKRSGT